MVAFTEIRFWIDGINTHDFHKTLNTFTIDLKLVIAPDDGCNRPVTPCWMRSVDLIDSSQNEKL